jgi:hypothetical protein
MRGRNEGKKDREATFVIERVKGGGVMPSS